MVDVSSSKNSITIKVESTNKTNSITTTPSVFNNSVSATADTAQYWSNLSRDYSEQAKTSAYKAEQVKNEIITQKDSIIADIENTGVNAVDNISTLKNDSLQEIETKADDIIADIQENGRALPMFTPIWSDHILNDASYLRADTFSWHNGNIYTTAYNVLLNEFNSDKSIEELEGNVTYKRTPSGFKIADIAQHENVLTTFTMTGKSWFYILDTAQQRFKLPRTQYSFTGIRDTVGGDVQAGLPSFSHTHTYSSTTSSAGKHGHNIYQWNQNNKNYDATQWNTAGTAGQVASSGGYHASGQLQWSSTSFKSAGGHSGFTGSGDVSGTTNSIEAHTHSISGTTATNSSVNSVYGKSNTVQPPATQMYLYFFVGNYARPATDINIGELVEIVNNLDLENTFVELDEEVAKGIDNLKNSTTEQLAVINKATSNNIETINANAKSYDNLTKRQITNCITEIPQRIKYTLSNGTLTIKAGSVVIVPYGTEDLTSQYPKGATFLHENFKVYDTQFADSKFFVWVEVQNDTPCTCGNSGTRAIFVGRDGKCYDSSISLVISGSTPSKETTSTRWYDTSANLIKESTGSEWVLSENYLSLPFAVATADTNKIFTSIDQVFNGMGYIGSTVWVDKGVKGLIPNGRNEDGTLNNIEYTVEHLTMRTAQGSTTANFVLQLLHPSDKNSHYKIAMTSISSVFNGKVDIQYNQVSYIPETNTIIAGEGTADSASIYERKCFYLGIGYIQDGKWAGLTSKQPFRAVDYNDFNKSITALSKAYITETYRSGTSWYRIYSDGWCEQGGSTGTTTSYGYTSVTYPKPFKDVNYNIQVSYIFTSADKDSDLRSVRNLTTTGCEVGWAYSRTNWRACGYIV